MRIGVCSQDIGFTPYSQEEKDAGAEGEGYQFPGGSLWYRLLSPLSHVGVPHVQGILTRDPRTKMLGVKRFDTGEDDWDCDVILLQRVVFPELAECMYEARARGQIIINDMDDWFDGLPAGSAAFKQLGENPGMHGYYKAALSASDGIVCSTPFLTDWYSKYAPTALWRNSIDFGSFPMQHQHEGTSPSIGWFGSLRFRARDVEVLSGIIGPYIKNNNLSFVHVGAEDKYDDQHAFATKTRTDPALIEERPPTTFILSCVELWNQFDIGLVPLEVTNFNHAKTALKGMEYTASGIPFIASPSTEYEWMHSLGFGRLARKPKDWKRHLDDLLDPEQRIADVKANRIVIEEHCDIKKNAPAWLDIIKGFMP